MKFEHLNKHNLDEFDCGVRELNEWFQLKASFAPSEVNPLVHYLLIKDAKRSFGL